MGIGPELPPHLAAQLAGPSAPPPPGPAAPADDDSDDDFGPALPPDMLEARESQPAKKVLGPQLPPGFPSGPSAGPPSPPARERKRETPLSNAYSDDSDDGFGPMPLPAEYRDRMEENEGARLIREREERAEEKKRLEAEGKGKMKREEWMLVPPKEMDLMSSMDPTKLKSRSFAQSAPHSGSSSSKKDTGPNLWTETPAERQQRMQDELMGKKRKLEISNGGGGREEEETDEERRKRKRDAKMKEEVERHNKAARKESLLDQHTKTSKQKKKDEDGPPGIWDRDRDMSLGGRLMDEGKRADIVKSAKELGGRFGGGSYL